MMMSTATQMSDSSSTVEINQGTTSSDSSATSKRASSGSSSGRSSSIIDYSASRPPVAPLPAGSTMTPQPCHLLASSSTSSSKALNTADAPAVPSGAPERDLTYISSPWFVASVVMPSLTFILLLLIVKLHHFALWKGHHSYSRGTRRTKGEDYMLLLRPQGSRSRKGGRVGELKRRRNMDSRGSTPSSNIGGGESVVFERTLEEEVLAAGGFRLPSCVDWYILKVTRMYKRRYSLDWDRHMQSLTAGSSGSDDDYDIDEPAVYRFTEEEEAVVADYALVRARTPTSRSSPSPAIAGHVGTNRR